MTWGELTLNGINACCNAFMCDECPLHELCQDKDGNMSLINIDLDAEIPHKIYVCHECGKSFDVRKCLHEHVGDFWGQPAYEDNYICPYCESDDLSRMEDILNGDL